MFPGLGYALILIICTGVIAYSLVREAPKQYPVFLYLAGLGMILTTTLAGKYLTGCDIHLEYYYAQLHSGISVLPPLVGTPQGTSTVNTVLAPLLGHVIPLLWVYKLVYPLIFALVPVIAYFLFRKWLTNKQAFLAAFVLVAFPPFFMEIPTVARHAIAEVVLVLSLFVIFKSSLRYRYLIPFTFVLGSLTALLYYTVTIIGLVLLGTAFVFGLFTKQKRLPIVACIIGALVAGAVYYPQAEDGAVALKLGHLYNAFVPASLELDIPKMRAPMPVVPSKKIEVLGPELGIVGDTDRPDIQGITDEIVALNPPDIWSTNTPYLKRFGPIMRSAIGLDFIEQPVVGKVFRVLQWVFMLLIPIGLWKLKGDRKYLAFAGGGVFLLVLLLVPGFTGLLSLTRVVHISLLVLAPAVAVAFKPRYLLVVLIPYFLFTSGFIFEITHQPGIESINIPYNYGLSNSRIDLGAGASINENDYRVRQYIFDNNLYPVYSDISGSDFVGELVGWRSTWNRALRTYYGVNKPEEGYFFLTDRNIKDGTVTLWTGAGTRKRVPISLFVDDVNRNVVYQVGNSRVLEVK